MKITLLTISTSDTFRTTVFINVCSWFIILFPKGQGLLTRPYPRNKFKTVSVLLLKKYLGTGNGGYRNDPRLLTIVDIGSYGPCWYWFFIFDRFLLLSITFGPWWNGVFLRIFVICGGLLQNAIEDKYCKKNAFWRHTLLPPSLPPTIKHKINYNSNYN